MTHDECKAYVVAYQNVGMKILGPWRAIWNPDWDRFRPVAAYDEAHGAVIFRSPEDSCIYHKSDVIVLPEPCYRVVCNIASNAEWFIQAVSDTGDVYYLEMSAWRNLGEMIYMRPLQRNNYCIPREEWHHE